MSTQQLSTLVYPLTIPQGVDWPGTDFPIIGPDGQPYDLTGCTARGQIRSKPGPSDLYFTWSTSPGEGEGLITLNVAASTLNVRVLAAESAPWTFTRGAYDVVVTNPAAPEGLRVSRVVEGAVTVSQEVTQ